MLWLYPKDWYDRLPDGLPIVSISFHTNGFERADVEFLCGLLKRDYDVKSSISKRNEINVGSRIQVPKIVNAVKPFVEQVSCMMYKIDLRRMTPME